jgi:hypothetical protein
MKDAYYFPHYCNARNDRKIRRVMKSLGVEGYGIYFMLLEVLRDQTEYRYPIEDVDLLAEEFGTSEAKVIAVIKNFGLFDIDEDEMFFSLNLIKYLEPMFKMRDQRSIAGKASAEARRVKMLEGNKKEIPAKFDTVNDRLTTVQRLFNENEQSRVSKEKDSKQKENIREESKFFARPKSTADPELLLFFTDNGSTHLEAANFFDYYDSQNWMKANNMPISNWQSLASNWIRRSLHDPRYKPKPDKKIIMTPDFSHLEHEED